MICQTEDDRKTRSKIIKSNQSSLRTNSQMEGKTNERERSSDEEMAQIGLQNNEQSVGINVSDEERVINGPCMSTLKPKQRK